MKLATITGLTAAAVGLMATSAFAVNRSLGIFSTGNNGTTLVTAGNASPGYAITSSPLGAVTPVVTNNNPTAWLHNSPTFVNQSSSQWISAQKNGSASDPPFNPTPTATYDYTQTFTLTNNDILSTGDIVFTFAADNRAQVFFNGTLIGSTIGGQNGYVAFSGPFTITSGFQNGINTLLFVVTNNDGATAGSGSATGLNVSISTDTISEVPEPSAVAAFSVAGLMLGGLLIRGRRPARRAI